MKTKYIDAIGIELEGGWSGTKKINGYVKDTSVQGLDVSLVGEAVSPPLKWDQVSYWINQNIPEIVNETCGLHVHCSLINNNDYIRLTETPFYDFFLKRMEQWGENVMRYHSTHEFWKRLKDGNCYCARDHRPEEQIIRYDKRGPRYTHLNYCYNLHGTLECRIFSASTDVVEVFSAVEAFVNCIEEYLDTFPQKENKILEYEIFEEDLELEISELN